MSAARNDGIEKASGEYLFCVDGDDYIDEDFFEKFYNNAKKKRQWFGSIKQFLEFR